LLQQFCAKLFAVVYGALSLCVGSGRSRPVTFRVGFRVSLGILGVLRLLIGSGSGRFGFVFLALSFIAGAIGVHSARFGVGLRALSLLCGGFGFALLALGFVAVANSVRCGGIGARFAACGSIALVLGAVGCDALGCDFARVFRRLYRFAGDRNQRFLVFMPAGRQ